MEIRAQQQGPGHDLVTVLAARLLAAAIVTALVAAVRIAAGPLAAFATGVLGVLVAIMLLVLTGYARTAPAARTHRDMPLRAVRHVR